MLSCSTAVSKEARKVCGVWVWGIIKRKFIKNKNPVPKKQSRFLRPRYRFMFILAGTSKQVVIRQNLGGPVYSKSEQAIGRKAIERNWSRREIGEGWVPESGWSIGEAARGRGEGGENKN